ncbi:asparagine synthase (glutamine-hydrolyzing) [Amycolatopsis regifaucium]|uniref:asparagine synthase (glutamine-hydrolyzing) n=1 Tax=Amycolatopsis regifaucium TaxID=546365 RepID=A0A154MT37_9PSEU|nr:asparagine synthase (glutamine-hydrolyzing) [Amycolatopsis regifaucium]KZB87456.1 asparagine synthetase B [Amycolatopsis regifaucium]OKA08295.1 asparagine synthase (glutamine-hydrolyzing) [Amycolatopsis regifaucium]SFI05757.1 asparagine synthase (glutamine-hydrolysing) [Amycolatopsis regifaucium]
MCGFVGWLDYSRDLRAEQRVLDVMTDTLRERGPDDRGTWLGTHAALGHRRLAVIDVAGGAQPMKAELGPDRAPVVLAYSGEIYNFRELRTQLSALGHTFRTASDTEVLLRAYLEWGAGCVERFNGMFAFAVWDSVRDEMVLARDRLGVKPLYYAPQPSGVLFASEPKGIMANPAYRATLSADALPILLNPRLAAPGQTPLNGLREVKPGHVVKIDRRGCHEYPYWRLTAREHRDDLDTTVHNVRELLEDIVDRQLVADVPRATMLSGGLDSSTVTALAARSLNRSDEGPLSSFSVRFEGEEDDFRPTALRPERDAPYAALAAKHLGTDHYDVVMDTAAVEQAIPLSRRARDLPGLGHFDASMYLMFAALRERSTVALSGEAADEVFGGYPWFHDEQTVWRDRFPWLGDAPRLADCLHPDLRKALRPAEFEADCYATLRAQVPHVAGESRLDARMREVLFFSLHGPLAMLLDRKDRMSMAVGLEVRVPFCDHRLLEYVWNVPWSMKTADGREKSLLRMAAADLLPTEVLTRPKSGYPAMHAPAHEAAIRDTVLGLLDDPASPLAGLLDHRRVRELAGGQSVTMTHVSTAHLLIPLLEVDTWMRTHALSIA